MPKRISKKEANVLAAYEPIESEFRTQAYKKWHNVKEGTSMFGLRWRVMEPDAGILTPPKICHVKKMDIIDDYFPLDDVENTLVPGRNQQTPMSLPPRASQLLAH